MKNTLTTCLWLNAEAEEALQLYTSLLPNSRMGAIQRGWLKDRFGVSWQVVPTILEQVMGGGDNAARERVTAAFMSMQKLDVAALKAAAAG